ncbi:HAMP domain-containing methyl-accepting chemotaxis protein [Dechloromonas sp. ZY10]|uniref:methyl-accepting chemotaxis protein n=1 Tax=Dechloromonas aquae TaxID=2664436 RepID=UPI003526F347
MTIAKRLGLLVLVSLISLLGLGVFSLAQIARINTGVEITNHNFLPSLQQLEKMQVAFLRARPPLLTHLIKISQEEKAADEKRFRGRVAELEQAFLDYEKHLVSDEDRRYLQNSRKLVQEYLIGADKVLELSRQGNLAAATQAVTAQRTVIDSISKNLMDHSAYNHHLANEQAALSEKIGRQAVWVVGGGLLVAGLLVAGIGFLMYRQVTGALAQMVDTMGQVEKNLDFTQRADASGRDEVALAISAFNRLIGRIQESFREIAAHSQQVHGTAARVATAAGQMSQASAQQSESASSMAATIEQMTVSINHVADRAQSANQQVASAGNLARDGERIINSTVASIHEVAARVEQASVQIAELEVQSDQVNNVVAVIKEVAEQTNLLALNAAIEAARAGEQGRGFAVVADEVRKLAERTALSTQEIAATISAMQHNAKAAVSGVRAVVGDVETGVGSAEQANQAIQQIGTGSSEAVELVGEITDAIREQSMASTSIAQQVERIAQMAEENSAAASATADSAFELATNADKMQAIISAYRI